MKAFSWNDSVHANEAGGFVDVVKGRFSVLFFLVGFSLLRQSSAVSGLLAMGAGLRRPTAEDCASVEPEGKKRGRGLRTMQAGRASCRGS